jgi:hypothetical protein
MKQKNGFPNSDWTWVFIISNISDMDIYEFKILQTSRI